MPIYEYQCQFCSHHFEQLQKTTDDPLKICPECHKHKLKKIISNTSFQLKGTGWYVTDFKDRKAKRKDQDISSAKKTVEKKEVSKKTEDKKKSKDKQ